MINLHKIIASFLLSVLFCCFSGSLFSQASFNMPGTLCAESSISVTAGTGTMTATGYSWSASPAGLILATPNSSVCDIYFPTQGIYVITLLITDGTSTATISHSITVHPLPVLTLSSSASPICVGDGATLTVSGAVSYTWNPTTGLYFLSNSVAYISPNSTSSYSVTGTSTLGCLGSTSYTINVNSFPNLAVLPTSTGVCVGFTSTLTAFGATNYTWTSTTLTTSVFQPTLAAGAGTYSLVGANGNCKDSTHITINLLAPLAIMVSGSRLHICKNDGDSLVPVDLNASGATSYTWAPFDPAHMTYSIGTTIAVSPTSTTCYTVTGASNVCQGQSLICVNVITCTALEEIENRNFVTLFPNPVQDKLFIRSTTQGFFTIRIINATGTLMLEENKELNGTQEVSVNTLPAGIYFVYLTTAGETTMVMRVVKQ